MAVPRTGKSGLEGALRTSEGPFGMVERHKTGEIALLRPSLGKKGPSLEKMVRARGMGRWELAVVMQFSCHQKKGVYQQNRINVLP